jgi:naphthoate synthase
MVPPTRTARSPPKVVICVVPPAGRRVPGDGHSLHVVADLTLASREHERFTQTDADVANFDGGFGSAYQARQVGQKFAREIFFFGDKRRPRSGGAVLVRPQQRCR